MQEEQGRPNWCLKDTVSSVTQVSDFILALLQNVRGSIPHTLPMRKTGPSLLQYTVMRRWNSQEGVEEGKENSLLAKLLFPELHKRRRRNWGEKRVGTERSGIGVKVRARLSCQAVRVDWAAGDLRVILPRGGWPLVLDFSAGPGYVVLAEVSMYPDCVEEEGHPLCRAPQLFIFTFQF